MLMYALLRGRHGAAMAASRRSVINNFVGRTNFDDDMIFNIYILYIIIVYLYTRFKNCAGVEYNASGARVSI